MVSFLKQKMLDFWCGILYNKDMSETVSVVKRAKKKLAKKDRIAEAAYQLFLEQGFDSVSVQEIADRAEVAKGTFYLYFHDREELKNYVITAKSNQLFRDAIDALHQTRIEDFEDQIVFIVDYVTNVLAQNTDALRLIAKNLSFGVFNQRLGEVFTDKADIMQLLMRAARKNHVRLKNPRILLFMIIELASSTCFSCILEAEPVELAVYKPYLFDTIRQMIRAGSERECCSWCED